MFRANKWKDLKIKIKTKFSKLSDADIEDLNGHMDLLQSKVKKTYGYPEETTRIECNRFNESIKNNYNFF
jgi:uncharacterized protein YjbJ (UPF0337 family)